MLCGTIVQTLVLFIMVYRTNWNKEVMLLDPKTLFFSRKKYAART